MDSVTQAVLGAAICDSILGKELGRKATWWGLFLGTLPDLDVFIKPWLMSHEFLRWHRGWSHGILSIFLLPFIVTFLMRWIHGKNLSFVKVWLASWLTWLTHVLLDCLTVYGTGILEPLSSDWVDWNVLFIIDPLYTLPLIVCTIASAIFPISLRWRPKLTHFSLIISTLYIFWAVSIKQYINFRFQEQISSSGINSLEWTSSPTPFNTFMWRAIVKAEHNDESGFWIGYASVFDQEDFVHWRWVPQHDERIDKYKNLKAIETLKWFSKGYWIAREESGSVIISDLRFGEMTFSYDKIYSLRNPWIFSWEIDKFKDDVKKLPVSFPSEKNIFLDLYTRVMGERFPWERP